MKYPRNINILALARHRSVFLFGPRQTGKTTLLSETLPEAKYYNLHQADVFQELSSNPTFLRQQLTDTDKIVIIDEIQKLPNLLNEVQTIIDRNKQLHFIFTGSSARKLRRSGVNLLGGRAWTRHLFPLTSFEVGFDRYPDILTRGGLPSILDSEFYMQDLKAYIGTYLQEEIRAEALVRSIDNFSRFLLVAGLSGNEQIVFEHIANDAGVPARTIREYYLVLVDTLVGFFLEPFRATKKRKAVSTAKFYFFDLGVQNFFKKRTSVERGSAAFGEVLEQFVCLELRAYISYQDLDLELGYWRSESKLEVDLTVGDKIAIEVKGKQKVSERDLSGIRALKEEKIFKRHIVVTDERVRRKTDDNIELIPILTFLEELWSGKIVGD